MPKSELSSASKPGGKRQRTGGQSSTTTAASRPRRRPTPTASPEVPDSVRQNIRAVILSLVDPDRASKRTEADDDDDDDDGEPSGDGCCVAAATRIQAAFADRLGLPHADLGSIRACEGDAGCLQRLAEALHVQTESAVRVFELLDVDRKGVVVLEDLQRVAPDILGEGIGSGNGNSKGSWEEDDLVQMVSLVDRSGDGLLTKDDMIRVARAIGL